MGRASLLKDISININRYTRKATHGKAELYRSFGLQTGHFFDRETWGADRLVVPDPTPAGRRGGEGGYTPEYVGEDAAVRAGAKQDLLRLANPKQPDYLPGLSLVGEKGAAREDQLSEDYLLALAKVEQGRVVWFFMTFGRSNLCVGADATPGTVCVGDGRARVFRV